MKIEKERGVVLSLVVEKEGLLTRFEMIFEDLLFQKIVFLLISVRYNGKLSVHCTYTVVS